MNTQLLEAHDCVSPPFEPTIHSEHLPRVTPPADATTKTTADPRVTSATSVSQPTARDLRVVVQLVEAACRARDGDHEATKAYIARAVRLLNRPPLSEPTVASVPTAAEIQVLPAGLLAWQARRVLAYVESNLAGRIRVRELAQLLGLSTSHFTRAFKRALGASPRTYVLRRRIEVAQGLMLTTSESLSSIALSCGMYDHAQFTRSFHRVVGDTPHSWRRRRRDQFNIEPLVSCVGQRDRGP